MLEIKNLHVTVDGREILRGIDLTVECRRGARDHGPERLGQIDARLRARRPRRLRGDRRLDPLQGRGPARDGAGRARRRRRLPRLPVSDRDSGRRHDDVPQDGAQRPAEEARAWRTLDAGLHPQGERGRRAAAGDAGDAPPAAQCRLLRRREEAERDPADGAPGAVALRHGRDRLRPRHRRAPRRRRRRQRAPLAGALRCIVITHYQRLLNYIVPDFVHVLSAGRIVRSGGKELALELEEKGYADFAGAAA